MLFDAANSVLSIFCGHGLQHLNYNDRAILSQTSKEYQTKVVKNNNVLFFKERESFIIRSTDVLRGIFCREEKIQALNGHVNMRLPTTDGMTFVAVRVHELKQMCSFYQTIDKVNLTLKETLTIQKLQDGETCTRIKTLTPDVKNVNILCPQDSPNEDELLSMLKTKIFSKSEIRMIILQLVDPIIEALLKPKTRATASTTIKTIIQDLISHNIHMLKYDNSATTVDREILDYLWFCAGILKKKESYLEASTIASMTINCELERCKQLDAGPSNSHGMTQHFAQLGDWNMVFKTLRENTECKKIGISKTIIECALKAGKHRIALKALNYMTVLRKDWERKQRSHPNFKMPYFPFLIYERPIFQMALSAGDYACARSLPSQSVSEKHCQAMNCLMNNIPVEQLDQQNEFDLLSLPPDYFEEKEDPSIAEPEENEINHEFELFEDMSSDLSIEEILGTIRELLAIKHYTEALDFANNNPDVKSRGVAFGIIFKTMNVDEGLIDAVNFMSDSERRSFIREYIGF